MVNKSDLLHMYSHNVVCLFPLVLDKDMFVLCKATNFYESWATCCINKLYLGSKNKSRSSFKIKYIS
jgi:hypothetical protein